MSKTVALIFVAIGVFILLFSMNSLNNLMNEINANGEQSAFTFSSILLNIVQPIVGVALFIIGMMAIRKRSKEEEEQGNV